MGLCVKAKGMEEAVGTYDCGYITYGVFLQNLARAAYGDYMGDLYKSLYGVYNHDFTEEETAYWNEHCNDDIDLLLFHSDCDGKFSAKECRAIYNAIKDLSMPMMGHNYGDFPNGYNAPPAQYNMLERWKAMFKYCANRRVTMYYT